MKRDGVLSIELVVACIQKNEKNLLTYLSCDHLCMWHKHVQREKTQNTQSFARTVKNQLK